MTSPSTAACALGEGTAHVWPGAYQTAELLGRSARGDETAFAEYYDLTCRLLFGLVMDVVRDRAMAEEVTHEAYMYVWRHSTRFEPDLGCATAWITTIAYRAAVERTLLQLRGPEVVPTS